MQGWEESRGNLDWLSIALRNHSESCLLMFSLRLYDWPLHNTEILCELQHYLLSWLWFLTLQSSYLTRPQTFILPNPSTDLLVSLPLTLLTCCFTFGSWFLDFQTVFLCLWFDLWFWLWLLLCWTVTLILTVTGFDDLFFRSTKSTWWRLRLLKIAHTADFAPLPFIKCKRDVSALVRKIQGVENANIHGMKVIGSDWDWVWIW